MWYGHWSILLAPAVAFKLTVAREQRPALYTHGVVSALIALYLAAQAGWARPAVAEVATAGLCHDLGVLHLDPEMLRPGHRMSDEERRALYAHPVIAHRILEQQPAYGPAISRAVLEHHERIDGSGYPRGATGAQTSPAGRLLAVVREAYWQLRELYNEVARRWPESAAAGPDSDHPLLRWLDRVGTVVAEQGAD